MKVTLNDYKKKNGLLPLVDFGTMFVFKSNHSGVKRPTIKQQHYE